MYIAKDLFGKRSLILGLSENGLCITSRSFNIELDTENLEEGKDEEGGNEEDISNIIKKYTDDYVACLDKTYIELPKNSLYVIKITKNDK